MAVIIILAFSVKPGALIDWIFWWTHWSLGFIGKLLSNLPKTFCSVGLLRAAASASHSSKKTRSAAIPSITVEATRSPWRNELTLSVK
jgi:hypothetical protein